MKEKEQSFFLFSFSTKMNKTFKQDKGVAGLTILLSLVVMLFVIGLLVMIFTILGSKLETSTYDTTTATVKNETLTTVNEAGENFAKATLRDVSCTVSYCINASSNSVIPTANYTRTNCHVAYSHAKDTAGFNNTNWKCTYDYTYEADNTATNVMNDTRNSVAGVTDWFDIFIVIGAMVVLILLTVIIITAIRSSGMVAGAGSTSGANQVGTA